MDEIWGIVDPFLCGEEDDILYATASLGLGVGIFIGFSPQQLLALADLLCTM